MANQFETELSKSFKSIGWWYHKLSVTTSRSARFTGKVPFDYIGISPAIPIGIEAKSSKRLESFPFSRIAEHQIYGLSEFSEAGWPAYILINFRKPKNKAYAVTIEDWLSYTGALTRKSVPKNAFESDKIFIPVPRVKINGALSWDLRVVEAHALEKGRNKWQNTNSNPVQTFLPSTQLKSTKRKPKADSSSQQPKKSDRNSPKS